MRLPNSRVQSAHREILSLAIDLDCMIIKHFPASKVLQASACNTGKHPLRQSVAMLTWQGITK